MNARRATRAIVRRSIDRRYALGWSAAGLAAFVLAVAAAPFLTRATALAALAVAAYPANAFDRASDLRARVAFFAMPLYGRELARALAVAPCLGALAAPLGAIGGLAARGDLVGAREIASVLAAAIAATLVALSARLRIGRDAALYGALAAATECAVIAPLWLAPTHANALSLAIAAVAAFVALRAFGETLARYDPLPLRERAAGNVRPAASPRT